MKHSDYAVMFTLHSAYTPLPSAAVALMVQVPVAIPFTTPFLSTWATAPLLVDQMSFLMVAVAGAMAAVREAVALTLTDNVEADKVIAVIGVGGARGPVPLNDMLPLLRLARSALMSACVHKALPISLGITDRYSKIVGENGQIFILIT